ncbi:MAG: hypothetical protein P4L31_04925 [Candidatus Babeliales bacterium]|nr:hypothetical protein [Candidatus Babeliales bacterium]
MSMQTNFERMNHDRVFQRFIIDEFIRYKSIDYSADYGQRFPDCIIYDLSMCIEETSVRCYDISEASKPFKDENTKFLRLKCDEPTKFDIVMQRIRKAVDKKQSKPSYSGFSLKYKLRVLLVRIDGHGFNWKKDFEIITEYAKLLNLEPKIFNSVYLVMYPLYPTQFEIENKIFERPNRSDFVPIL